MSDRAAAAEARRLKILGRGKDRMTQITIGMSAPAAEDQQQAQATSAAHAAAPSSPPAASCPTGAASDSTPSSRPADSASTHTPIQPTTQHQDPPAHSPPIDTPPQATGKLAAATAPAATAAATTTLAAGLTAHRADESSSAAAGSAVAAEASDTEPWILASTSSAAPAPSAPLTSSLQAAADVTRMLRALLAMSLAYLMYNGHVLPMQLGGRPSLAFMAVQAVIILSTHYLLSNKTLNTWMQLHTPSAAPQLPFHLRGIDLTSMVPGLKPLLQALEGLRAVVSGVLDGVAVFIVSYVALTLISDLQGGMGRGSAAPEGECSTA